MDMNKVIRDAEEIANNSIILRIEIGKVFDKYLVDIMHNNGKKTFFSEGLAEGIDEAEKKLIDFFNELRRENGKEANK